MNARTPTSRPTDRRELAPTPALPWVDVATGSLGQGLPYGVGMALAGKRLDRLPFRVWVLCGDSELTEGSIWEALEHAAFYGLDNLIAIVIDRAQAFGCRPIEIDGHDVEAIDRAYTEATGGAGAPVAIVARTVEGKGVAAVEDRNGFHGRPLADPAETLVAAGITLHEALAAADALAADGVAARLLDLYSVKPLDEEALREAAEATGAVVTVEDHQPEGGIGEAVLHVFAGSELQSRIVTLAVAALPTSGTPDELLVQTGIDRASIVEAALELVQARAPRR